MPESLTYTGDWFAARRTGARRSAEIVLPIVLDLIGRPASVVDLGCGTGSWLAVLRDHGVDDVLGIDGHYVDRGLLEIPEDRFLAHDLRLPLRLSRRFELAISLEVGEHLPPHEADRFVETLTALAPVVLFSAAVPHQGGTGHLNEQWQDEWADRFRACGFTVVDAIRPRVWDDAAVKVFYRQNTLLFVRTEDLASYPELERESTRDGMPIRVVHPAHYLDTVRRFPPRGEIGFGRLAYFVGRILGLSRVRGLVRKD
jgi:SAM-dependent methyltransferase